MCEYQILLLVRYYVLYSIRFKSKVSGSSPSLAPGTDLVERQSFHRLRGGDGGFRMLQEQEGLSSCENSVLLLIWQGVQGSRSNAWDGSSWVNTDEASPSPACPPHSSCCVAPGWGEGGWLGSPAKRNIFHPGIEPVSLGIVWSLLLHHLGRPFWVN